MEKKLKLQEPLTDVTVSEEAEMQDLPHRGIYLLPNLFTLAGLFAGFYAIVASMYPRAEFETAAMAIFIAMIFDSLDGRVARMTNTVSDFGAQFDSLSDIIAFGVAPALVAYNWGLSDLGKFGWLVAFTYTAATGLRLARFNTMIGVSDKKWFQGLPSPAAAGLVAGMVWICEVYKLDSKAISLVTSSITAMAAVLMVSNVRFYSFKEINLKGKVPFVGVLIALLLMILIAGDPPLVLFSGFFIYAISGPLVHLRCKILKRQMEDADECDE